MKENKYVHTIYYLFVELVEDIIIAVSIEGDCYLNIPLIGWKEVNDV